MSDEPAPYRFTVDEYVHLGRIGFFSPDDRLELIDGEIIRMSPIGRPHAASVNRLTQLLVRLAGDHAIVSVQNPLQLGDRSMPQPDLTVLAARTDFYASRYPDHADTLLAVEVSDTTLPFDRIRKARLYARHGVPVLWVVDVKGRVVHVLTDPGPEGYATAEERRDGDELAVPGLPGEPRIPVAGVLP